MVNAMWKLFFEFTVEENKRERRNLVFQQSLVEGETVLCVIFNQTLVALEVTPYFLYAISNSSTPPITLQVNV